MLNFVKTENDEFTYPGVVNAYNYKINEKLVHSFYNWTENVNMFKLSCDLVCI
jgi:hypothetical protein